MIIDRLNRILEAASKSAKTRTGRSQIDSIQLCTAGYAEPGYSDPESGVIAFGNWNSVSRWEEKTNSFVTIDDTLCRVGQLLEKLGVELEWSDEWLCCDNCGKAVRCKPDCYSWKPSYWQDDCEIICCECLEKDPTPYLESLEGDTQKCVTLDLDLEKNGYVLLEKNLEHGFYHGQDADPKLIGKALKEQGINRIIFSLDSTGQFDISFSVWVHKEEMEVLDFEAWEQAQKDGPSVSEGLRRALEDASKKMAEMPDIQGHPKVAKCDPTTGAAKVRLVTPQEFLEGKALDY